MKTTYRSQAEIEHLVNNMSKEDFNRAIRFNQEHLETEDYSGEEYNEPTIGECKEDK